MKKIITALMCLGMIAAMLTGCGYNDALENSNKEATKATESSQAETTPVVKDSDYKDTLAGLADYFADKGYIAKKDGKIDASKVTKMDASLIGAKEGKKYQPVNTVFIEFYSYDTANLNDTAKDILVSVKDNGTFSILDLPAVKAYISDNGKYLMVYTDTSINDEKPDTSSQNYITRENAIKDFKAFHAE